MKNQKEKSNGHQKHAYLVKPNTGNFSRNEWAILGTPCGKIKRLAFGLTEELSKELSVAYVDADHKSADEEEQKGRDPKSALSHGGHLEFTDKITFSRFDIDGKPNSFEAKPYFQKQDIVLVNGNHFQANRQIVVIDPKKSLEKRINQLTHVDLILHVEEGLELPQILLDKIPDINKVLSLAIDDVDGVASFIKKQWSEHEPKLKGLVLAGGRSTRMGHDKGKINYHGKDQRVHMWEVLDELTTEAFVSIRPAQDDELADYPTITDSFMELGPYGAILSAFRQDPNAAWLVVACDQPFLTKDSLGHLISNRNLSKVATCFHNPETDFPEPLITIWEPRAYPTLLSFLSMGYSCPRKVLINSDTEVIPVEDQRILKNVNTPEEYQEVAKQP